MPPTVQAAGEGDVRAERIRIEAGHAADGVLRLFAVARVLDVRQVNPPRDDVLRKGRFKSPVSCRTTGISLTEFLSINKI
jgi:hypothetical protein